MQPCSPPCRQVVVLFLQQVTLNTINEETWKAEQDLVFMRPVPSGEAKPLADGDTAVLAEYMPDEYKQNPAERLSGGTSDSAPAAQKEVEYVLQGSGVRSNGETYDTEVEYASYLPVRASLNRAPFAHARERACAYPCWQLNLGCVPARHPVPHRAPPSSSIAANAATNDKPQEGGCLHTHSSVPDAAATPPPAAGPAPASSASSSPSSSAASTEDVEPASDAPSLSASVMAAAIASAAWAEVGTPANKSGTAE